MLPFFNFLLDQGTFCGATDWSYLGLHVTLLMGFKARVVLFLAQLLLVLHLYIFLFTSRGVHYISMYSAGLDTPHTGSREQAAVDS